MRRIGRLVGLALGASVVAGGCVLSPASLDGPLAVELNISTTPTSINVEAPTWFAPESRLFLCPADPPPLPEPGPARIGWEPGGDCVGFAPADSKDGLEVELPTSAADASAGSPFLAADDWYLLILDVREDRVVSGIRTRFPRPDGWPAA